MSVTGAQAQQVQTFQIQTQQIQTDSSAVAAIDAGVKQLGIKESVDALGDAITERLGEMLGAGINKAIEKSTQVGASTMARMDALAPSGKPDSSTPAVARSQEISVPQHEKAISQSVADQVAGANLKLPPDIAPPVHIEAAQVAEMAANSAKQAYMSQSHQTQTQMAALG